MDLRNVRIDTESEVKGVWVEIDNQTKLLIASAKSPAYKKVLRDALRTEIDKLNGEQLDEEKIDEISTEILAEHILLGWEGLTEGGEPIVYSTEKAYDILTDKAFRQFKEFVVSKADDISLFRDTSHDVIVEDLKKS